MAGKGTGRPAGRALKDIAGGHNGYPDTPLMTGSPNVTVNGQPAARVTDEAVPHTKSGASTHNRFVAEGSKAVRINGLPAARMGDAIHCGGTIISGSGNVRIGDNTRVENQPAPGESEALMARIFQTPMKGFDLHARQRLAAEVAFEFRGEAGWFESWKAFYKKELRSKHPPTPDTAEVPEALRAAQQDAMPVEEEEEEEIVKETLYIGVFCDGTWQHRDVDRNRTDRDVSNVVKLWDLYDDRPDNQEAVYVPGVGIEPGELDDNGEIEADTDAPGGAMGIGGTGARARVDDAMQDIRRRLDPDQHERVVFDVFGFSRGAAIARHLVNVLGTGAPTDWHPDRWPHEIPMEVRFVGLFDTVASLYWPANGRHGAFNLNLGAGSAERVVHFTAHHEIRRFFPLTRIADAHGNLPDNCTEIAVPGVHANVGGGYENPVEDSDNIEHVPVLVARHPVAPWERDRRQIIQHRAEREGHTLYALGSELIEVRTEQRHTHKALSIYYLHRMYDEAQAAGVPLRALDPTEPGYRLPQHFQWALEVWQNAGEPLDEARERWLLGHYIHTSHRFGDVVNAPAPEFERTEHFNRPELAGRMPGKRAPDPRVLRDHPERFSEEEKALIREQDAMLRRESLK
ncbi:hypothetical protein HC341_17595 [Aquisalimonas sp. 2447]|uniref:phospholipase effector Tle1 domain-containing protein n=1 Tax=Aquisalimonas sp. 2447 TaxID=2740807 RepID=UPI0014324AC0|nr:DUF2235 domain-containing protein [Aquisalimonas sp. 2447]QIT56851.1 hypothetical protein HC341_17595 [Aquisalimonas sp. 2447]